MTTPATFLSQLNSTYAKLHKTYEDYFWDSYMGNAPVADKKDIALKKLDAFRGNVALKDQAIALKAKATRSERERLDTWIRFFNLYQVPEAGAVIREEIARLETKIQTERASRTEGYIDPHTKAFVAASTVKMRTMIQTHPDEAIRKACYEARETLAHEHVEDFVTLVRLRNQFANTLGYSDFYDYKLRHVDGMTKAELFGIFDEIKQAILPVQAEIRAAESNSRGLRQPWNFLYKLTGDYTKAEEPFYQFDEALPRWLTSFARLGVSFGGGTLTLDLLDRAGKYNNGFCQWPELVRFDDGKRLPGRANFTCVVVPNQIGSGKEGYKTLFHEGGHAAHFLSITERDICLNHEYAPMTAAWAETQSMFMDTLLDSYEWKSRYAQNSTGDTYSKQLYITKYEATRLLRHTRIMPILFIAAFERAIYECKKLDAKQVLLIAKRTHREYFDQRESSLLALNTPHIYSWESACSYHGYGLAEVALHMWREYFYKKYGYIVDNKQVGKEMLQAWRVGSRYDFKTMVKNVTGKTLSAKALIRVIEESTSVHMKRVEGYLKRTPKAQKVALNKLNATIRLVHGKKVVATSDIGYQAMVQKYQRWIATHTMTNT